MSGNISPSEASRSYVSKADAKVAAAWLAGLTPEPLLTVSQWSDRSRILSQKAASEPGLWRTDRTPYLRAIMDVLSASSSVQRVAFMKGAQIGAPLALSTPIPTRSGWTTMGEIAVGDEVFSEEGVPCCVVGVSQVFRNRQCWDVQFSDGSTVKCDGTHLWTLWDEKKWSTRKRVTISTDQIAQSYKVRERRNRYALEVAAPLCLPEVALPIPPYSLGAWLGDGAAASNRITTHIADVEEIAARIRAEGVATELESKWSKGACTEIKLDPSGAGDPFICIRGHDRRVVGSYHRTRHHKPVEVCAECQRQAAMKSKYGRSVDPILKRPSFGSQLSALGLRSNKHIPPAYLRSSQAQRLELLRGLMDTDGHARKDGRCELSFADRELADDAYELLQTLGIKARTSHKTTRTGYAASRGKDPSVYYTLDFLAYSEEGIFGLGRKADRLRSKFLGRPGETKRRRIVKVSAVPSEPVRCISVDSRSSLYLCGRSMIPTHNTESGLNWIGYVIDQAPGPMLAVAPTVDMAKRSSKQRIAPMIEESAALRGKVREARSRDSGNTVLTKEFPGGVLVMTGANSAVGLRSMPARYVFLDEVDGYPGDVDGEGDPVALAEARTRTFQRRKVYMVSTPTIAGRSRIEREYLKSDQRRFFVPCPKCGHFQTLKFASLKWNKGEPRSARYVCENCASLLGDEHKTKMLALGEWRPTATGDGRTAGFHLSSLYSPVGWLSWIEIAQRWEAAQGDPDLLKEFVNTVLGETWQARGDAPDWDAVYARRGKATGGTVPIGAAVLFAGVDGQKDRLEVGVWAFGRNRERFLIEHRVLPGPTNRPEVWASLAGMLDETWPGEDGGEFSVRDWGIDSGAFAAEVGAFVRNQRGRGNVWAIDGLDRYHAPFLGVGTMDLTVRGKKLPGGLKTLRIGVSFCKQELVSQLALDRPSPGEPFPPGFIHLPADVTEDQVKQLTSESLVTRTVGGRVKREWQVIEGRRNEVLDCANYARGLAAMRGWDRWREPKFKELEALRAQQAEEQPPVQPSPVPAGPTSNWLDTPKDWL